MSSHRRYVLAAALLLTTVAIPVLGATPAGATPVDGGVLKNTHPVNGVVGSADGISYTFTAKAGQHVTLAVTNVNVIPETSGFTLSAYDSHGNADVAGIQIFTAQNNEIDFTPTAAQAGKNTVVIGPWNAGATGTFTLTMAHDAVGALTSGGAVHPRIRFGGQHADYTFTAVAGRHVTVAAFNGSFTPQAHGMTLSVYGADGQAVAAGVQFYAEQTREIDYTPTATQAGLTHVVVTPYNYETTGKLTLGYAADTNRRLTLNKPVQGNVKFAGGHVLYTFRAVAGQPADLLVTNAHVSPVNSGQLQFAVYDPNGVQVGVTRFFGTGQENEVFYVPTAGQAGISSVGISTYTSGSTGSFTFTYSNSN